MNSSRNRLKGFRCIFSILLRRLNKTELSLKESLTKSRTFSWLNDASMSSELLSYLSYLYNRSLWHLWLLWLPHVHINWLRLFLIPPFIHGKTAKYHFKMRNNFLPETFNRTHKIQFCLSSFCVCDIEINSI